MNLLVVSNRFWPEGGGAELATYLITELLATEQKFVITVATGTSNPSRIKNVHFFVDPILRAANKPSSWLHLHLPWVQRRFRRFMREFDLIYLCQAYPLIPLAKSICKKVVVHVHDYQPISYNAIVMAPAFQEHFDLLSGISKEAKYELLEHGSSMRAFVGSLLAPTVRIYRYWTNKADAVICVSRRQAQILSHFSPELRAKIEVIHNPLPSIPLTKKENVTQPTFLYLGGDSYVKGFRLFLRASQKLLEKNADARFLLTGGFRDTCKSLVQKLNATSGGSYALLGQLAYQIVLKLQSRAQGLVFPSICEETWGYAVIEAMLSGTIPIASRVGGLVELVEGTVAEKYLFDPGDLNDLVKRMEGVLSLSKQQLNDVGAGMRESVLSKFDADSTERKLLELLGRS